MNTPIKRRSPWCTACAVIIVLLGFALLRWRANLPGNEHRTLDTFRLHETAGEYYLEWLANTYDDSVTRVTARNFARDGFLRTHLLPNRGRFPLLSFWDSTGTQCDSRAKRGHVLRYVGPQGREVDMASLNNDCVYGHYPPLADWAFGVMALAGFDSYSQYRFAALAVSCAFLLVLYFWLRCEVSQPAALVATILTCTLPGFVHWADALYYHSAQYLLLVAGFLAWTVYLRQRLTRWFVLTWWLFFLESVASYQLIFFFAVFVVALTWTEPQITRPERLRITAVLASAPMAAFMLHTSLRVSFVGFAATWSNLVTTAHARMVDGASVRALRWTLLAVHENLLALDVAGLALVTVVAIRSAARLPLRRPLLLLGVLLAGAVSKFAVFPGTTLYHSWMMYRHAMPFVILLLALQADALGYAARTAWTRLSRTRALGPGLIASGFALASLYMLCWPAHHNVAAIAQDVKLSSLLLPHGAPHTGMQYLDVLQWSEGFRPERWQRFEAALDGVRVEPANAAALVYHVPRGDKIYNEVWWLEQVPVGRVSLLTEEAFTGDFARRCSLSVFDEQRFRPLPKPEPESVDPFVRSAGESAASSFTWLRYELPAQVRTRALRLTCTDLSKDLPLHELEIR